MSDDLSSRLFAAGQAYTNVETFAASSKEVNAGAFRLEGAFYGSTGYRAIRAMQKAGFTMVTFGHLADVLWIGPFKRMWVEDPSAGVPFHSSSTMLAARPEPSGFIDKEREAQIDWRRFGAEAIELCEKYGKRYYIKYDLARHLDGIEFTNTDTRKVNREALG